ncbi:Uma2 family endonuclease [Actinoplanes sp. NBC_00393]|uniref:Uma2 family endonuclease n=1 Tax=Actinoplanes sp. NBC_00393 TaxID=2975953 RepID=UPI002E1EC383
MLRVEEVLSGWADGVDAEQVWDWVRPPEGGFTADDLDRIPGLPRRAELVDGALILMSPQKRFHMKAIWFLGNALSAGAPREIFRVSCEMSIVIGPRQRPEPDVLVVRAEAEIDDEATWYPVEAVVLAVEVVSPESEIRDRERKPQIYAEAGIPNFWLVDRQAGRMTVSTFELDAETRRYVATGSFQDRLQVSEPFEIDIDLTEIDRM